MKLNEDFEDLLDALEATGVRFLVVGAHALAAHGVPRATSDIDILVQAESANARRVYEALVLFGAPVEQHRITARHFETEGDVYQMGLPPRRVDLLTRIDGVSFEEAWNGREEVLYEGRRLAVLGLHEFIANKRAAGRLKDLADLEMLRAAGVNVDG
ncbi:MAG: hypothetical protein ACI9MC_000558 [Kiritimatiellia bacterium]